MFFAQNEYGQSALCRAFDSLPIDTAKKSRSVARFLGITEATLHRYLSGKADPPRGLVYAIWHESPYGLSVTSAHSERAAYLWRSLAKSQADTIAAQRAQIAALQAEISIIKSSTAPTAANDLFFAVY